MLDEAEEMKEEKDDLLFEKTFKSFSLGLLKIKMRLSYELHFFMG